MKKRLSKTDRQVLADMIECDRRDRRFSWDSADYQRVRGSLQKLRDAGLVQFDRVETYRYDRRRGCGRTAYCSSHSGTHVLASLTDAGREFVRGVELPAPSTFLNGKV